jgi:hypothetical protein
MYFLPRLHGENERDLPELRRRARAASETKSLMSEELKYFCMKKILTVSLFLSVFLLAQTAVRAQKSCAAKLTKDDMEFLLKDAPPNALKSLENPETKKKQVENLRQMLALACAARKEGLADDPAMRSELEDIRIQIIAVHYDREINKDKDPMPPFGYIDEARIKEFWEGDREAEFQKFFDLKIESAKASGQIIKDKEPSAEEIKQAREYFAKTRISEQEATGKWNEMPPDFRHKVDLAVMLQQAQYLSRLYAEKVVAAKTKVTDEEVKQYIAEHSEFDTKAQKAIAEKILLRVKSGENFAKLAKEFSEDPGSKEKGGLYKNVPQGQMVLEFEQAALALKPGQIAPNLVETKFGFHIIKLEKRGGTVKTGDGEIKETYDVRHILILTTVKDPDNPMAQPMSPKEFAKSKLEEQREKEVLDKVLAENPVEVADDFTVPIVSVEELQKMMQKQMQIQMPKELIERETEILPAKIKRYLNRSYKGWELQKDVCESDAGGRAVVSGNFNGDKAKDYAVKFSRDKRGFIIAFLALKTGYAPFVLQYTSAENLQNLQLFVWSKGERYKDVFLRYDAVSNFKCESQDGGIHLYRNGKFIAY